MGYSSQFNLPLRSWGIGNHQVSFSLDDRFFLQFEGGILDNGHFEVICQLNKLSDSMMLNMSFDGHTKTNCDRCLAPISLPLRGMTTYLIKFDEKDLDEGETIFIDKDKLDWNISTLIWDTINLAVPLSRVYDCETEDPLPCDTVVLQKIDWITDPEEEEVSTLRSLLDNLSIVKEEE